MVILRPREAPSETPLRILGSTSRETDALHMEYAVTSN
jgi:hypothetical protein